MREIWRGILTAVAVVVLGSAALCRCADFQNPAGPVTNDSVRCPSTMEVRQGACWPLDGVKLRRDAGPIAQSDAGP